MSKLRAYYAAHTGKFLQDDTYAILGELTCSHQFALEELQKNAWVTQIRILKRQLSAVSDSFITLEYTIPRMGKRVDAVLLYRGLIYVLEFKVGATEHPKSAIGQVLDYCLDLKNFHEQSHQRDIVPILVSTLAPAQAPTLQRFADGIYHPIKTNQDTLGVAVLAAAEASGAVQAIDPKAWMNSAYRPTPTIIEAAQALYRGHDVSEISRSDAGAINLGATTATIHQVIEHAKNAGKKAICFVTGVPGAGKTLAGLNIANQRHNVDQGEHAVFLSGNGPLVEVLQEALARDEVGRTKGTGQEIKKSVALSKTRAFIQNIHHFRDDNLGTSRPPIERVAVFDEAQRAWTAEQAGSFMAKKKGIADFEKSEPEFLIEVLDRHPDWAVIVCLIGGGQEINTGEAGLTEWFSAIQNRFANWEVYASDKLTDAEYTNGKDLYAKLGKSQLKTKPELHLSVSVRSYRSEKLAAFVKAVLDMDAASASALHDSFQSLYPIFVTRDLSTAKAWLKAKARGSEGLGIVASSGAYRLKPYGLHVKSAIDPKNWFLNDRYDVRSAGFLEDVATEFDVQGLELDWICLAWDANLRVNNGAWVYKDFRGSDWQNVNDKLKQRYLLNSYRVLLTRARQGMTIFVPKGDPTDRTRLPEFYDPVFEYLIRCGIRQL